MERRVPSDVVVCMFYLLTPGLKIENKNREVFLFFYRVSLIKEFAVLFKDFIFDTHASYPKCETVAFGLQRLRIMGTIQAVDGNALVILNKKRVVPYLKLFTEDEYELLEKLALRFEQEPYVYLTKKSMTSM